MVSNPSLVFKAQLRDGQNIVVEDYLDAYLWLNKNTPDDARVLSWYVLEWMMGMSPQRVL